MTTLTLQNKHNGKIFDKQYDDSNECRKFLLKLQYSKNLRCIDITTTFEYELEVYRNIRLG